ncbi:unnamed protein product [Tilletia controversa]|uniref:Late embryogenesis abundant protein LEA-2 subgroup domain-containing protein n=2 Tax=Tilletia TaxID=13289 RepID=A0A177URU7_9BASI|nr:hypothetical protein CF336_g1604 [Tilletia laevis]KAE8263943.1 hypothetical protein A4X03_0g1310 [Tilletia caries]CAD6936873.1 unnamed protein product [Tilletia controversa]KAE8207759.1 hypothetical protein CF335_g915 [Tilletia laevis]CAD6890651.1 unnamed protein product [Tilletia caries]
MAQQQQQQQQHGVDSAGADYPFQSPYSQASYENQPSATAQSAPPPNEHGAFNDDHGQPHAPASNELAPTKERPELYSNTFNNTGADPSHDYPTRNAAPTSSRKGAYTDAPDGAAAYGRSGIWTHAHRSAFQRRSTPIKILRSLCCVLLLGLIVALSAVLLIITFARPPNVAIGAISSNQTIPTLGKTSLSFNMSVDITVANPNAISATLTELEAVGYDAVRPTVPIGRGKVTNVPIGKNANTTFSLPFVVAYDASTDDDRSLITDIATKCGWLSGSSASQLDFTFKMNAHLSVLFLAIPFSFSVSPKFTCPIPASSITSLLGQAGGSLDDILKALGVGGSGRRRSEEAEDVAPRLQLIESGATSLSLRDVQFADFLSDWRERAASLTEASQVPSDL